ncbi:MAG: hypothetical protein COA42_08170 [Alteromonadaceae bacterium]|nr:MAG: hypothetical protein COA42_08170 [Alteromonadaceae bacterium]
MTKDDIKQLKQALLDEQEELLTLEAQAKEDVRPVKLDQSSTGRLTRMDAMQAQEMALENARRRKRHIVKISEALQRINNADYGYCLVCDEEVALKRLQYDPALEHCIGCAEQIEQDAAK